jgi:lycopene beta-cyclase
MSRLNQNVIERSAPGFTYQFINSLDFYRHALAKIQRARNIELKLGQQALAVTHDNDLFRVETEGASLRAQWLVDTRPPQATQLAGAILCQSFVGQVVSLAPGSPGAFEPGSVELMTDMQHDAHGLQFSYVLPFDRRRALVEITRFSPAPIGCEQLGTELKQLLERRGWQVDTVERVEAGMLPMGLPALDTAPMPGLVRAGTGAGALRAASGYGFQRIQRWARACSESLARGGAPVGHPTDSVGRRFMDRLFLQVLRDQTDQAPRIFERMIARVPGPVFVRFMSDQARWTDGPRIVNSVPWRPFLKSLHHHHRSRPPSRA